MGRTYNLTINTPLIRPVILCGGSGTRLWPLSRESMPKQFVELFGPRSTFQQVLERVAAAERFAAPIVITNAEFRFIVADQARAVTPDARIVLEPMARDSAAAIAACAELASQDDPAAPLLVLAADHLVPDGEAFRAACASALSSVRDGMIATFGVTPTYPATGYGYIRPGAAIDGAARRVAAFVEKPDAARAERYVAEGCLWNSGNFMFRADAVLEEFSRHEPAIREAAAAAVAASVRDIDFVRLDAAAFASAPRKSFDYAVMERTERAVVIPTDYQWSDVGSWDAVRALCEQDADGNALIGLTEVVETRNSLVRSEEPILTAVLGLDGVVVVTTSDAVLVAARDRAEEVKALVERLKARGRPQAVAHRHAYRPWGYYQVTDIGERYQVKRIGVKPGGRLSLQKHFHRSEHWVVVRGTAEVTIGDKVVLVHENESIYVPMGAEHRLANPGKIPLELIEVQVGSYLGEDDIVRIEDVYRRGLESC
jgi:mannose-1-phosphate guanylyltransferase / mannose-6-phosphate isomerase